MMPNKRLHTERIVTLFVMLQSAMPSGEAQFVSHQAVGEVALKNYLSVCKKLASLEAIC
jgi:hypothetical protein